MDIRNLTDRMVSSSTNRLSWSVSSTVKQCFQIARFQSCHPIHAARRFSSFAALILFFFLLLCDSVSAHAPEKNYVWLNIENSGINGRFEVNFNDIRIKLGIDVDAAGESRLDGVKLTAGEVQSYFLSNFSLESEGQPLLLTFQESGIFEKSEYLQYPFTAELPPSSKLLTIKNTVFLTPDFMATDKLHRSLIVLEYNKRAGLDFGSENVALVFGPHNSEQTIDLTSPPDILVWTDFFEQGVIHIWWGIDHVLFVVVLLLTTVLVLKDNKWSPQPSFGPAFWKTLKIVTLFTLAHSITLTLAALQLINVNTALVESVIAFSIIGVAVNNIIPFFSAHAWIFIFGFGLFHGLGFATVMGDLQFRNVLIERIVILFNLGIEVGQIVIVCLVFPILYLLRNNRYYRSVIVIPLSLIASVVALYWMLQRSGVIA